MRYIILLFISILTNCFGSDASDSFSLEGKWKDIKTDNIYEKDRKEILFDIQRIGEDYVGKVISLDNAIESNGEIRKCAKCIKAPGSRMLLGFPVIENLRKSKDGKKFIGKIYDIQQGKWFDLSIQPKSKNKILVRIYAGIPLFGKSITWERGEEYYHKIVSQTPLQVEIQKKGVYALTFGEIDTKSDSEVTLKVDNLPILKQNNKIYFYSEGGKKTAEGVFIDQQDGIAKIKLIETFPAFSKERSLSVILYQ
jgi:uncharacterized protein (DUF2147 family)